MVDGAARAYYDASVWVAYIMGDRDGFFGVCAPLFDKLELGLN